MTLEQLRLKHPRLVYKNYTIAKDAGAVTISHEFLLEPDIVFRPKVVIPCPQTLEPARQSPDGSSRMAGGRSDGGQAYSENIDTEQLESYAFNLGLVEAISYWKAACPGEFIVEAGPLDRDQIRFWYDLFIHGLGEFFYRNQIDFTKPDFLRIQSPANAEVGMPLSIPKLSLEDKAELFPRGFSSKSSASELVLVGGGKDSAVVLGMMKKADRTVQTIVLNPTQAALDIIRASGLPSPIIVQRVIDPKLPELNANGYLNGHTPFSAYLAFLGVTVAALYGNENVIVSNEKSADEGNVVYHGMEINHQYSKSFRFEEQFRKYVLSIPGMKAPQFRESVVPNYFSFLRPLNNMQIALVFSRHPEYFTTFRSCNVGRTTNTWCTTCAKCAFTFLTLFPFLSYEQMVISFGKDLLTTPEITNHIRAMTGLISTKPFECVGTRDEAKLAVTLAVEKYKKENREVPEELLKIKIDLALSEADLALLQEQVMDQWADTYNVPEEHLVILRSEWERTKSI